MTINQLSHLIQRIEKLKDRVREAGLPVETIDELTFEQAFAANSGDKIAFLLERDSGASADALFPGRSLRKTVSGYLVSVGRYESGWLIRKILPLQNAVVE